LTGRWFFYKNGGGNCFHNNHLPKKQHEIIKRESQLDENELKIAEDGLDINLSSQSMAMMFKSRTGLVVDPKKLRNHHVRIQQPLTSSGQEVIMTPAEQVICKLTSSKNVSVVYLVAKVTVGRDLVTTYTKQKKKGKSNKKLTITFESNVVNNGEKAVSHPATSSELLNLTVCDGSADTPEKTAEDIYHSLGIDSDAQILLSISWCTDKQRRLLALFPEAASADVLFKTNNEKRPLKHICSKTSCNETFGGFYSFLPSQAIWVFDYMWSVAVPALVDPRFLLRNEQMNTDGDDKMYNPFITHISSIYKKSKQRLCAFHLFTQGWPQNGITSKRIKDGASEIGVTVLEVIKNWVISWTSDVESPEELQISYELLMLFLEDPQFMNYFDILFADDVKKFLTTKVWQHREKFAYYHYMGQRCFGMRTSNDCEIEGGILKHHSAGPKPNFSIAKSADTVCEVSDFRIGLKEQKAAKAMDSMPTEIESCLVPLYSSVTRYCGDKVVANWNRRLKLTVYRHSLDKFYVKPRLLEARVPNPRNHDEYEKYLRPRFERTRIVEVFCSDNKHYLRCSCKRQKQHGYICEDICAVLDTAPNPDDIAIRWHKSYYATYLSGNPELDNLFDKLVENEKPGPSLGCESLEVFQTDLAVGECTTTHSKDYFVSSLPSKTPKLHPGVMWATVGPYANKQGSAPCSFVPSSSLQTVVALSQTAVANNVQYKEHADQDSFFQLDMSLDDEDNGSSNGGNNDGDGSDDCKDHVNDGKEHVDDSNALDSMSDSESNAMDVSMATYASKSPERTSQRQLRLTEVRAALRKTSAMSLLKPKYEAIINTVGGDPELFLQLDDTLSDFYSHAMAKKRMETKAHGVNIGMHSLPATDKTRTSKRIESCPTGNHGGKGKKRTAKKPP